MSFWGRLKSVINNLRRSASEQPQGSGWWPAGKSRAGVLVTHESALTFAAVWGCVRVISESIAQMRWSVYANTGSGPDAGRTPLYNHPADWLLAKQPNPEMPAFIFRRQMLSWVLTWGNAYAEIERGLDGRAVWLWPIEPWRVGIDRTRDGTLYYLVQNKAKPDAALLPNEMYHVRGLGGDGIMGYSVISMAKESIGLGLASEGVAASTFGQGMTAQGGFKIPGKLSQPARDNLTKSIDERWLGQKNWRRPLLLEEGLEWQNFSMSMQDAQFLECLAPESKLSMADGTLKPAIDIKENDCVLGWDGERIIPSRVSFVGDNGIHPCVRITTHRGRVLITTLNHPYFASKRQRCDKCGRNHIEKSRRDGLAGRWYKAEDLSVGDYVRVGLGYSFEGTLSEDEAWMVGALLGDGHLKDSRSVGFTNADKGVVDHLAKIASDHGFVLKSQSEEKYQYYFAGGGYGKKNKIRHFLQAHDLIGLRSYTKFVPDSIFRGGRAAWVGLLSGMVDTDGTVRPETARQPLLRIDSVSKQLLEGCQHLFALLGIQSALGEEETSYKGQLGLRYGLTICGRAEVTKAAQILRCHHVEKARRLAAWAERMPTAREHEDFFLFDRIVSMERLAPARTVSIEIEGTHTHVTNGLITHNSRKFQVLEICRWFRVPPHKVADLDRGTFSNIEHQSIEFVIDCLVPWAVQLEQEADLKLFGSNRQNLFTKLNVNSLLRGDQASRFQAYAVGRQWGWLSVNDVRRLEDMNPLPDHIGSTFLVPFNYSALPLNPNQPPLSLPQPPTAPPPDQRPQNLEDTLRVILAEQLAARNGHSAEGPTT